MRRKLIVAVAVVAISEVARAIGNVSVTPSMYLLDKSGRTVAIYVDKPDWQEFQARVERAFAESA